MHAFRSLPKQREFEELGAIAAARLNFITLKLNVLFKWKMYLRVLYRSLVRALVCGWMGRGGARALTTHTRTQIVEKMRGTFRVSAWLKWAADVFCLFYWLFCGGFVILFGIAHGASMAKSW